MKRPVALRFDRTQFFVLLAIVLTTTSIAMLAPTRVRADVDVQRVESDGGIVAWLVQDDTVPGLAIEFSFALSGGGLDKPGKEGTANLVSATMDEGAGDLDSTTFQRALADQSIRLRFDAGYDGFNGSFYTLNRYRDQAVDLLRLALNEPRFDEEAVERIRRQIRSGMRQSETDPGAIAGDAMRKAILGDHRYGMPLEGTPETLATITIDDLRDFVGRGLSRDRLYIGVVGDIEPDALKPILDTVFGQLPETGAPDPMQEIKVDGPAGTIVVEQDVPQSTILFAQRGVKLEDPDFYVGMVLNHVLGGGSFSSELTKKVRVERGLAYSVYSFMQPLEHTALWRGGAGTQNARVGETIQVIRDVIADIKENGVPEERVADAKTYLTGSYPLRFTNSSSIAGQLVNMQRYKFGIDYIDTRNSFIEVVTADQVNALARELLNPDNLTFVVVGKPTDVEATLPTPALVGG